MSGFLRNAALSRIDPLGLDQYKVVCARRDELHDLMNTLPATDVRRTCFRAQLCILNQLCFGACCASGDSVTWINGVVDKFVRNMLDAVNGKYYADNAPWKRVGAEIDGYQISYDHPSDGERSPGAIAGANTIPRYHVPEIMVTVHVGNDLRQALMQNGIGHNIDWFCVGKVIKSCSSMYGPIELWAGKKIGFDIDDVRDKMRLDVYSMNTNAPPVIPRSPIP